MQSTPYPYPASELLIDLVRYIYRGGSLVTGNGAIFSRDCSHQAAELKLAARGYVEIFTDYEGLPYMVRPTERGFRAADRLMRTLRRIDAAR